MHVLGTKVNKSQKETTCGLKHVTVRQLFHMPTILIILKYMLVLPSVNYAQYLLQRIRRIMQILLTELKEMCSLKFKMFNG
jgi:hypothetical protein